MKKEYNHLLERIEKAEKWFDRQDIDYSEKLKQYDNFKAILNKAEKVLSKIKKQEEVTSEQINNGFKEVG